MPPHFSSTSSRGGLHYATKSQGTLIVVTAKRDLDSKLPLQDIFSRFLIHRKQCWILFRYLWKFHNFRPFRRPCLRGFGRFQKQNQVFSIESKQYITESQSFCRYLKSEKLLLYLCHPQNSPKIGCSNKQHSLFINSCGKCC